MANLSASGNGYTLGTYPDCDTFHHGQYEGLSVYVVGRWTDSEKLFRRNELALATTYMNETGLPIEAMSTGEICDQAVLDLYQPA